MKISLEWLGDYLTWSEKDPRVIAERLTRSTAEVEELEMQGEFLEHCCVGEVLTVAKHPSADRLLLADVKTDEGTKRVVCGGTNLKEGMLVAFAHIGATVKWHGGEVVKLEPVKIRGEKSEGMICAAEELGIETLFPAKPEDGERPIIDLSRLPTTNYKLQTGLDLRKALNLTDTILHISNTAITARPDLFSHEGFARECIALGLGKAKKKEAPKKKHTGKSAGLSMKVDCPDLIPRYLSVMLEIDGLGETPDWMKRRLQSIGLRSVNLPVDITNYVMNDIGVPMHSFDAGDIHGDVHMRLSKKGEHIDTLDGEKRALPPNCLVLSDDDGVFDLVGIMGGMRSSTKESTRMIFLHALSIDPVTIRRAITGTGLRTDASTVYEKGVPPVTTERGFHRALELFLELVPGAKVVSAIEDKGHNGKAPSIKLSLDDVRATLGINIKDAEIVTILGDLECDVKKEKTGSCIVTPPLHRLRDLLGPHDLLEEIGRIHDFDKIPSMMPSAPLQLPKRDIRIHGIRENLQHAGYWELVPLSLVSPDLLERCNLSANNAVRVKNPIGEETSLLQSHPLPQLLAHAQQMLPRTDGALQTFQCSHVFAKDGSQRLMLATLMTARHETGLLDDPFLLAKQTALDALKAAGYNAHVAVPTLADPMAHPGRHASIVIDEAVVGSVFEVHPLVRTRFDLPHRAAATVLDCTTLLEIPVPVTMQKSLSVFPAVTYDVTVTRTQKQALGPLLASLRSASDLLEEVIVQDVYAGKPLKDDEYNLTLRFVYRAVDRTLTEDEVKKEHDKLLAKIGSV